MGNAERAGRSRSALRAVGPVGLTAIVPCFNEAAGIERAYLELVTELSCYDLELLFVDDGSTDGTLPLIRQLAAGDPRVGYISFSRNFGLEAAFGAGFRYAGKPWLVQIDADLQSPPAEIHRLLERALGGEYDVVFGTRRNRKDPWFRRCASRLQHWIARRILGIDIPPGASTFRVIRTSVARKITDLRLGTPYFVASVAMVGARSTTVVTEHRRRDGRSRFAVRRLFSHAVDLFFGFSLRPFALPHAFAALAAGVTLALALLSALGMTATTPTLLAVLGLQTFGLIAMAVLGRYLMGLVKQAHPLRYLVRETNLGVAPEDLLYESEPAIARVASGRPA